MRPRASSTVTTIVKARFPADLEDVVSIFREYVASPTVSLDFQENEIEFASLPGTQFLALAL